MPVVGQPIAEVEGNTVEISCTCCLGRRSKEKDWVRNHAYEAEKEHVDAKAEDTRKDTRTKASGGEEKNNNEDAVSEDGFDQASA